VIGDLSSVYRDGGPKRGIKVVGRYARADLPGCKTSLAQFSGPDSNPLADSGRVAFLKKNAKGVWKERFGTQAAAPSCREVDGTGWQPKLAPKCLAPDGVTLRATKR
jgi:hypothetical protein